MEGPFVDPGIPDGERTAYRGLLGGEEAGEGEVIVVHASDGGRDVYRQSVTAAIGDSAEWRAEVTFARRNGRMHADDHRLETFSNKAEPVAVESSRFRHVKVVQFGGEVQPYPRDLAPLLGCAVALRGLELEPGAERAFTAWIAGSVMWPVETKVEKSETIEVPAGKHDAWRVRLRPSFEQVDAALDRLMEMLVPPIVVHLAAESPHRLLRCEFPTGPFKWNPPGLIEATELSA
jgi:hypothetical protein